MIPVKPYRNYKWYFKKTISILMNEMGITAFIILYILYIKIGFFIIFS